MTLEQTDADFDSLSWHDNALYGLRLDPADAEAGDWRSDLILSIDHIVEWVKTPDAGIRFRVAPAHLIFHDVGDLRIAVDWQGEMLHDMSIHAIEREALGPRARGGGVRRFFWRIRLNWPAGGTLSFEGGGFTQRLRAEPVLLEEQAFSPEERRRMLGEPDR